ncbi:MAG: hypothetical protein HQM11_10120 [SAR324 cluster bacterium]|nr:hypothetical protein [SAR324 cluster bacterium]
MYPIFQFSTRSVARKGIQPFQFLCLLWLGITLGQTTIHAEETQEVYSYDKHIVVLKVYFQEYDWLLPWNKKSVGARQGAAIVVGPHQLLTTAQMVNSRTLIQVRHPDKAKTWEGLLTRIDASINLALLDVADEEFWKNLEPVSWGEANTGPVMLTQIKSVRNLKTIPGTITRLSMGFRPYSRLHQPIMFIEGSNFHHADGHGVFEGQTLTGMAVQSANNGLEALPSFYLQTFLQKAQQHPYSGFPNRGFTWQKIADDSIRDYHQIPQDQEGVWINRVLHGGVGTDVLQPKDFLTGINEWNISNEGNISHPQWGDVLFDYLLTDSLAQQTQATFHVIRQGKPMTLQGKVTRLSEADYYIPLENAEQPPTYVLRGGLLFQPLTMDYLTLWGNNWNAKAPLRLRLFAQLDEFLSENKNRHIILLTRVLPDPINIGYQDLSNMVVTEINGKSIQTIQDVVSAFDSPSGAFHQIRFLPGDERMNLVLPVSDLPQADQRILQLYQIPQSQQIPPNDATP